MKTLTLLTTLAVIVLTFSGEASMHSTEESVATSGAMTVQGKTRFSSRYSSLSGRGCGSGMTKKEEREAEERGTDLPNRCKGFGGYEVHVGYSACSAQVSVENGTKSIPLIMQSGDFKQNTIEWRMAQAKGKTVPFAVIMREYEYAGDDLCATGGKITAEFMVVQGLDGFEHIHEKIDVKTTPNPNLKARQLADGKYSTSP